ncbi:MAG: excinuclease ABC subunit B [Candidatus Omnitrophica bacterium CG1_02_49_16]|nr:MAG: excinuclease ABC subunit B [Candidatus Omnitrophica bacterium CG1_02_49_16]
MKFKIKSPFSPKGDQPQAIDKLVTGLKNNERYQTLLGVTGSGKTFTIAHVIAALNRPTLVISHNKTLAAQLYSEFKEFFPDNAVEYFVSYYDYYQPEAYIPHTDTYIEKDSSINEDIDRLRLKATSSLLSRRDCVVVASVSAIYGLGSPEEYSELLVFLKPGEPLPREDLLKKLVDIRYDRNDIDYKRGTFRVRGDSVEIYLAYEETAIRVEYEWDRINKLSRVIPLTGETIHVLESIAIYPAKHFVTTQPRLDQAMANVEIELNERLKELHAQNKLVEAQRLEQRTRYDMEMMRELGFCSGIENYSRIITGRAPGSRPYCLIDYFPKDFLTMIDESHISLPQIRGMYFGDRARKETLVNYGFRLPSALDNRPLRFDEFEAVTGQTIFISATPSELEIKKSSHIVEQIIRPTGLLDPSIEIKPTRGQVDDLLEEIHKRAKKKERVLVTTLTKRMSEELSQYLENAGVRVRYIHSEIDAIARVEILRDLRLEKFDCLVGINLLREGIDLPEVSLVAVLDADKEGFLRSQTSLTQIAGRAARHANGHVILYADKITESMRKMILETTRRRKFQIDYNKINNITPMSIQKEIREGIEAIKKAREIVREAAGLPDQMQDVFQALSDLEGEMEDAAKNLKFERAIELRDQIKLIQQKLEKEKVSDPLPAKKSRPRKRSKV